MRCYKVSADLKSAMIEKFSEYIKGINLNVGNLSFCEQIPESVAEEKISVIFSMKAYIKMRELVDRSAAEVGWYGLVNKISSTEYRIEDVIVYPQTVTSATVKEDEDVWDDEMSVEDIRRRRFHGHSHVNMRVCPSAKDTQHRNNTLDNLSDNDYYIFLITNKMCDINIELYDLAANTVYDTKDIAIDVDFGNDETLVDFIDDYKKKVKKKEFTLPESKEKKKKTKMKFDDFFYKDI